MTAQIDFYYDLASPNTYMANQVVPKIEERTGATFRRIPCLLGGIMKETNNLPPFVAFANIAPKMAYGQREMERFVKKHGLSRFKLNPHFPFNTLTLMRAATAADMDGQLTAFIRVGEKLVWEDGANVEDPEVFVSGFTREGLDGAALLAKTQDPAVKAQLIENTGRAIERGVFGVPAFFHGEELYFGKDHLRDLEDEIAAAG